MMDDNPDPVQISMFFSMQPPQFLNFHAYYGEPIVMASCDRSESPAGDPETCLLHETPQDQQVRRYYQPLFSEMQCAGINFVVEYRYQHNYATITALFNTGPMC